MTIRTAVIGVGAIGRHHARVYSDIPEVELVGVADTRFSVAESISRRHGGKPYADFRQLLDEQEPDAVTIAVPTCLHLEIALQVIARGIHTLVEKPLAIDTQQGAQIIEAAKQANVLLMVGHVERFNPAVTELKRQLGLGEMGRIFQIDARRQGPFPHHVTDVGVVMDLAVHDLDIIRYLSAAEIERVYAETRSCVHSTHEDLMTGLVRLDNGVVGTLTLSWLTPTKIRELFVTGEHGMFRVDYLTQDLFFFENATTNGGDWETMRILRGVSEGRMIRHVVQKQEPLRAEQEAFVGAIVANLPAPVTGHDGLKAIELAQAVARAGLEHRPIMMFNNGPQAL